MTRKKKKTIKKNNLNARFLDDVLKEIKCGTVNIIRKMFEMVKYILKQTDARQRPCHVAWQNIEQDILIDICDFEKRLAESDKTMAQNCVGYLTFHILYSCSFPELAGKPSCDAHASHTTKKQIFCRTLKSH